MVGPRYIITGSMMTEFERKVGVWQFGQIGRLLGSRERQYVRGEMIRDEGGFALLTQTERERGRGLEVGAKTGRNCES